MAFEDQGIYLLVAVALTAAILAGYLFSIVSRLRDARRDLERAERGSDCR